MTANLLVLAFRFETLISIGLRTRWLFALSLPRMQPFGWESFASLYTSCMQEVRNCMRALLQAVVLSKVRLRSMMH